MLSNRRKQVRDEYRRQLVLRQPIREQQQTIEALLRPIAGSEDSVDGDYELISSAQIRTAQFAGFVIVRYKNDDRSRNPDAEVGEQRSGMLVGVLQNTVVIEHAWGDFRSSRITDNVWDENQMRQVGEVLNHALPYLQANNTRENGHE